MANVDLRGKVINAAGTAKASLTVELWEAANWELNEDTSGSASRTAADTTDADGEWNFDSQDATKTWLVAVLDGDKKFLVDARNKIQLTDLDLVSDLFVDTISEHTSANGVVIDSVTLKDGGITATAASDFGTGNITTGGIFKIDVDGSAENAAGSLTLGAGNDAGVFFDGTDLILITNGSGASGIILDSEDDTVVITGSGTVQATFDTGGLNLVSGDAYEINDASVLNATTLGSAVVASSLTSVGTLTALTMGGDINLDGNNIDNGGVIFLKEQAEADTSVTGSGQIWVDTAVPNVLMFTDDAGTDFTIAHNATTSLSSLVTVGALSTGGSITTGFGAIDNGGSNITTGGILKLDIDGSGVNAAGSITFGAGNDAGIWFDGTNMVVNPLGIFRVYRNADASVVIKAENDDTQASLYASSGGYGVVGTQSDSDLRVITNNTNRLTIDNSGSPWAFQQATTISTSAGALTLTPNAALIMNNGLNMIGETANANMEVGLTINQGANDNQILAFKSSDINTGLTSLTRIDVEVDDYATFSKYGATTGGLLTQSLVKGGAGVSYILEAFSDTDDTAKNTSADAPIEFIAWRHDGSNANAAFTSDTNAFVIKVRDNGTLTARFIFDVEGTFHADVGSAAFDDYNDVELLRGMQAALVPEYKAKFGEGLMYNLDTYERLGLVGKGSTRWEERPDGRRELRAMVNQTGLAMLHHSTILQMHDNFQAVIQSQEARIASLEERIANGS
jgi:hypothetical protein